MRETILQLATQAKRKIAVAESCTGGMLASALTDLPGSSAIFECGFVTYSNAAKIELLGVSADTLARHGSVSEPVAMAMACGALDRSGGDIALSITGIAGPGGSDHKPEGRVCFGLALSGGAVTSETIEFGAKGRDAVRIAARDYAMGMLLEALKQN